MCKLLFHNRRTPVEPHWVCLKTFSNIWCQEWRIKVWRLLPYRDLQRNLWQFLHVALYYSGYEAMWPNHILNNFYIGLEGFLTISINFHFFYTHFFSILSSSKTLAPRIMYSCKVTCASQRKRERTGERIVALTVSEVSWIYKFKKFPNK